MIIGTSLYNGQTSLQSCLCKVVANSLLTYTQSAYYLPFDRPFCCLPLLWIGPVLVRKTLVKLPCVLLTVSRPHPYVSCMPGSNTYSHSLAPIHPPPATAPKPITTHTHGHPPTLAPTPAHTHPHPTIHTPPPTHIRHAPETEREKQTHRRTHPHAHPEPNPRPHI